MMQQNIVPPQFLEQVLRLCRQPQLARYKRLVFQVWAVGLFINVEQTRKIYWTIHAKYLPGFQAKVSAQPLGDFWVGIGVYL